MAEATSVSASNGSGTSGSLPNTNPGISPLIIFVNPNSGSVAGGNTVFIIGLGLTNATAITFDSTPATSFTIVWDKEINAVVPRGPSGGGTVSVRVTGPGGTSNPLPYTYNQDTPVISTIKPTSGPTAGGNTVVITGSGFTNITAVTFGSTPAFFTVFSDTVIHARVPPGPSGGGTVSVHITGPGGTSPPGLGSEYTYTTKTTTPGISPTLGTTAGGDIITIIGSGFTGTTQVDFGNTHATSFIVVSDTEIQAITPAHSTGTVLINISGPGGTDSVFSFSFVDPPVLTLITPHSGPTTGGTVVSVTGQNLASSLSMNFGDIAVVPTSITDDNMVTAISPAIQPTVPVTVIAVTVTTAAGISNGLPFLYM